MVIVTGIEAVGRQGGVLAATEVATAEMAEMAAGDREEGGTAVGTAVVAVAAAAIDHPIATSHLR
jgi:hypothetical protein